MRTILMFLCILIFAIVPLQQASAQAKIAWVNSQAIMDKLPEAQDAQRQIDNLVAEWQSDLAKMQNEWQKKYEEYDKKKLILTDQLRAQSEKELQDLDKKIADYRTKKFGQNGELFNKQNELMKPVQNKIFKVIQDIAKEDDYDYVFDKSGDILLMYTNDKYDLTSKVYERLTNFNK
ncbi:MAG: OmpH family outer membrane protein [Ignavibacteria bacterium]|nr:OmpH family outer membrane protein [Ignavibacteria bacterium]MBI3765771.1 OmpH family outer membrane protein [Ignavibacteriales bacterium]